MSEDKGMENYVNESGETSELLCCSFQRECTGEAVLVRRRLALPLALLWCTITTTQWHNAPYYSWLAILIVSQAARASRTALWLVMGRTARTQQAQSGPHGAGNVRSNHFKSLAGCLIYRSICFGPVLCLQQQHQLPPRWLKLAHDTHTATPAKHGLHNAGY